jgi:hypothetical protein
VELIVQLRVALVQVVILLLDLQLGLIRVIRYGHCCVELSV